MNKGTLLNIAEYLGSVKTSEIKDAESRHAIQGFFRSLRKIAKPILGDIDDTRREIFSGHEEDIIRWDALERAGTDEAKKEMASMTETKVIVDDFRLIVDRIASEEVTDDLPKIDPSVLLDAVSSKGMSFSEFEDVFGEFFNE